VVLVTLDTTRGDVLGQGFTPNLEALAARGARFDRAFATTNSTIPSHPAIFTGLPLEEHGAIGNRHAFGVENTTLAERLRAAGYRTAAAVSVSLLRPGFGFGQGFDRFELPHAGAHRDGAEATEVALEWLDEFRADDAPFFLWLHLFDAHTPYGPPEAFARPFMSAHGLERPPPDADPPTMPTWDVPPAQLQFLKGQSNRDRVVFDYHLSVAYADSLVGRLVERLEHNQLAANTLLLVTADHGESLGERDYWFEHGNLYPEVIHVPLILAGPGVPHGEVVAREVSLIDVLPTVLAAAGQARGALEGLDLSDLARSGTAPERKLWFQLSDRRQAGFRDRDVHFVATLEDGLRWISGGERNAQGLVVPRFATEPAGTAHLFDLSADPDALSDVAAQHAEQAAGLTGDVRRWVESRAQARATRRALSPSEEQDLQDLGYAGDD
jgi:arylsulfatase A-like enzyme